MENFEEIMRRKNIGLLGEQLAPKLLNSKEIKHIWKKNFKKNQENHEKWDLINSEGIKIEVKTTLREAIFRVNSVSISVPEQRNQIVLKVLIEKNKIKKFKFVKFINGKWKDITSECLIS